MLHFPTSPFEIIKSVWRNRELIYASTKREVLGRYRGSFLGLLWSLLTPIFMLAVYTFVFGEIFKARWNDSNQSQAEFALVLFAGLIVFNLFAECINRAPSLILSNPNYVKKVVFPLEILPCITLCAALYHALISFTVWLIAYTMLFGPPPLTVIYLPLVILPFSLFILGLGWILTSLGVFLRDVSQLVNVITTTLMFLSPIFYPASALPEAYRYFIYLNPLTFVIEMTRNLLYWGKLPELGLLVTYWLASSLIAWLGFVWFQKTRKGFADVL
ncbi:ABC transporter permease [Methylobacillus flagellatus]|uniref:ABC transporter permease n=1 Tax=Methylobacillus flagellatus TaxID=405 RepID=UPI002853A255|nr:ABC transporter permease [Methylobacillus flagellatus]MDR5172941.1 ABC transporter permease [Methylobacillus flagellatus]